MNIKAIAVLSTVLAAIVLASGCTRTQDKDANFAREVIDAVYAGSLSPIQDSLTPQMQQAMTDTLTAQTGAGLRQQFGEVQDLNLKSSGSVEQNMTQKIWRITADRGTYEMRLVVDKNGKLAGLWFQPSSPE